MIRTLKLQRYGNGILEHLPSPPNVKTFGATTGAVAMEPIDFGEEKGLIITVRNIGALPLLLRSGEVAAFTDETTDSATNNAPIWLFPGEGWSFQCHERPQLALKGDKAQVLWWQI